MANRLQLYQYKGNCCSYCGLSVKEMISRYGDCSRIFDFNHVNPATKAPDYKNIIRRNLSAKQLDEVDKCILLCKLCHGILHEQSINGILSVSVTVMGRTAKQQISGQIIIDKKSNLLSFLSNEPLLLHPYRLKVGDSLDELKFGLDIHRGDLLNLIRDIDLYKKIIITSWENDTLMFQAISCGFREVIITQNIKFPFCVCNLQSDNSTIDDVWIRNGFALSKGGEIIDHGELTAQVLLSETLFHRQSNALLRD